MTNFISKNIEIGVQNTFKFLNNLSDATVIVFRMSIEEMSEKKEKIKKEKIKKEKNEEKKTDQSCSEALKDANLELTSKILTQDI